ncbi:trichohyalin [Nilaparvata lugens]|uniref:trichohyalin n=1 Tax=Nilaparvata lugens TaxID=108931 RepID=UPI00193D811D|nr:trichohyalin [Nilaparvata lugens]
MLTVMEEAEPLERQQLELELEMEQQQQQQEQDLEPQELEDLEQQELELEELEQQELEQQEQYLEQLELEQQDLEELEQQEQELEELEQQELEELEQQEQELEELEQQEQDLEELEQQELELEEQEQELEELEEQELELEQQEMEELNQQEQRLEHEQKEPEQQKPQEPVAICKQCSATYSVVWWRWINPDNPYEPWKVGTVICNDCWAANDEKKRQARKNRTAQVEVEVKEKPKVVIRKSARIRNMATTRSSSAAARKQINYKAPDPVLVPIDSEYVLCNNTRFRRGDIVSLKLQGQTVYAQLRGFLKDQYCNKSTVITWLMPTARSRPANEGFEPSTYQIGFEEDSPRPLTDFRFEMRAPNKFYLLIDHAHPPCIGDPFQTGYIPDSTL